MGHFFHGAKNNIFGNVCVNYFCYGSVVQNKLMFEVLFSFSTAGWLYRSTVHIGLCNFGI